GHQECHERLDAFAFSEDLSPGYSKRPAMAEHLSPGDEAGAPGGCEEVDLVLDGEDVTPGSGVGVHGETRCGIGDCTNRTAVKVAVLLPEVVAPGQFDRASPGFETCQPRSEPVHEALALKMA